MNSIPQNKCQKNQSLLCSVVFSATLKPVVCLDALVDTKEVDIWPQFDCFFLPVFPLVTGNIKSLNVVKKKKSMHYNYAISEKNGRRSAMERFELGKRSKTRWNGYQTPTRCPGRPVEGAEKPFVGEPVILFYESTEMLTLTNGTQRSC